MLEVLFLLIMKISNKAFNYSKGLDAILKSLSNQSRVIIMNILAYIYQMEEHNSVDFEISFLVFYCIAHLDDEFLAPKFQNVL